MGGGNITFLTYVVVNKINGFHTCWKLSQLAKFENINHVAFEIREESQRREYHIWQFILLGQRFWQIKTGS